MMSESISIFVSYAHEDDQLRKELEKHLSQLKWGNLIGVWHDRDISAGTDWEREVDTHLNTAQIILLLISPDFMASTYCYSIEMAWAMERYSRGEACVIPIILRPVFWKGVPFSCLQALPTDAIPVTSHKWPSQDEAFVDVVQGIWKAIEDLITESPTCAPQLAYKQEAPQASYDRRTGDLPQSISSPGFVREIGEGSQKDSLRKESPSSVLQVLPKRGKSDISVLRPSQDQAFFEGVNARNLCRGGLLVVLALLLAAVIFFSTHLISFPACFAASCHSSQPSTGQTVSQNTDKVSDSRLSVMNLRIDSSSYFFPGDPWRYSRGANLPTDVGAVLLTSKTTSSYGIVLVVQNVQHTGNSILIDSVTLQLLHIFSLPRPLTVWTSGTPTTDTTHPYPTTYTGQESGQLLYAVPFQNVSLAHDEPDQLDIQVHSTVSAYLQFKVAITYHIASASQTFTLPWIFQVIFSDASNWQEYTLYGGSLVPHQGPRTEIPAKLGQRE